MTDAPFLTVGSHAGLVDALTDTDPVLRCSARAMASVWPGALQTAAIVGNLIATPGHERALQNFRLVVDQSFVEHANFVRRECEAIR